MNAVLSAKIESASQIKAFPKSIEEIKPHVLYVSKKVADWDMEILKKYLVSKGMYSEQEAKEVEIEYKRFLSLCISFPQLNFAMARAIDNFWHCHILFTEDYAKMCESINGGYLHHRPAILDSDQDLVDCFADNTLTAYKDFFGEPNKKLWDAVVCNCVNNTCCTITSEKLKYSDLVSA